MTYSTSSLTAVPLLAYHIEDNEKVRIQIGSTAVDLDLDQRRDLAEYLTRATN